MIYTYDQRAEQYVEVNDVDDIKAVHKMIHKEIIWSGEPYYYVVKLPKTDPKAEDQFYPLPLVYADKEEQEASAKEAGKEVPSDMALRTIRCEISYLINHGPLKFHKKLKWNIPEEYRGLVSKLVGDGAYDYDEGDAFIEQILRNRGEDALVSFIEDAGYSLDVDSKAEFAITFNKKHLGLWNPYDRDGAEGVCLRFAAYCCAARANNTPYTTEGAYPAVEVFIKRLREWLKVVNE